LRTVGKANQSKMEPRVIEHSFDTMTIGWRNNDKSRNVELEVQGKVTPVTVSNGVVKKNNLKPGDVVKVRLQNDDGVWGKWFEFTQENLPAPAVLMERDSDDATKAAATITYESIPDCGQYEVAMLPHDSETKWITVKDTISTNSVRKKNLRTDIGYSFKYRANLKTSGWTEWSAVSVPQVAPKYVEPSLSRIITSTLLRGDGKTVDVSALKGKVVGLYFSAHWCGPCRNFTPKLSQFYKQLQDMKKPFEVIFVSADQDQSSFQQYFKEMPWLAVPFDDARREQLMEEHQVRGIPCFKIISSKTGKVIEPEAARYPLVPATFDTWQSRG